MLSVRSLAKIARKRLSPRSSNVATDGQQLFVDAEAQQLATSLGSSDTLPKPSSSYGKEHSRVGRRAPIVGFAEPSPEAAAASSSNEAAVTPARRWPSVQEIWQWLVDTALSFHRMGGVDLTVAIVLLYVAVYTIRSMISYLAALLDMQLPSTSSVAIVFFRCMEPPVGRSRQGGPRAAPHLCSGAVDHPDPTLTSPARSFVEENPVLFLFLDFGIATALGTAFLFLQEIQAVGRDLQARVLQRNLGVPPRAIGTAPHPLGHGSYTAP